MSINYEMDIICRRSCNTLFDRGIHKRQILETFDSPYVDWQVVTSLHEPSCAFISSGRHSDISRAKTGGMWDNGRRRHGTAWWNTVKCGSVLEMAWEKVDESSVSTCPGMAHLRNGRSASRRCYEQTWDVVGYIW